VPLEPITDEELIIQMFKNNQMREVMLMIKQIDKDHNGYVTLTELDDILKIRYESLKNKDLSLVINKFASIQNRILIDYKLFRDWVQACFKKIHEQLLRHKVKK
jgi:Ca2+-binding EF-hand superfamily protein